MDPERGYHRLREHRLSLDGQSYFVTTCCAERQALLIEQPVLQLVQDAIYGMLGRGFSRLDGYALMPDHFHMIFALEPGRDLAAVMRVLKTYTSLRSNRLLERQGAFWQDGYYDHLVRSEAESRARMDYMLLNPVRARLVEKPDDYVWCRCGPWWAAEKSGPVAPPTQG
ncbi:MAG: REP-associated tyrosine transposase [Armatimonadota bacterium]